MRKNERLYYGYIRIYIDVSNVLILVVMVGEVMRVDVYVLLSKYLYLDLDLPSRDVGLVSIAHIER